MSKTETETRKAPQVPRTQAPPDSAPEVYPQLEAPIDRGPEVVATTLSPQLASDPHHLGKGNFDMRKLSVISEKDIPLLIYVKIRGKKSETWRTIYDEFLTLPVSVGGRGRRDIIRMEGVSKGGLPEAQPELEKPGWLQRNFTDRDWRRRAKEEQL